MPRSLSSKPLTLWPGELNLTLTFTDVTSDLLQDDVDLTMRFGALNDSSDLVARHLMTQDRVICASPAYLRMHGEPTTLADVRAHRCIVDALKGPPGVWFVSEGGVDRRITPPATHRFSDGEAMVAAAIGGLGLAQLPVSFVREHVAGESLRPILQSFSAMGVEVHAVWPRQKHLSPRVRCVVDQPIACAAMGRLD